MPVTSFTSERCMITTLYDLKSLNFELKAKRGDPVDSNAICEAFALHDVLPDATPPPSGWGTGPFVSIDHCAPAIESVKFNPSEHVLLIKVQDRPSERSLTNADPTLDTFYDGVNVECVPFFGGNAGPVVSKFHEYESYLCTPLPASVTVDMNELSTFKFSTLILRVSWSVVCAPPGQTPRKHNTCPARINDGKGTTVVLVEVASFEDDIEDRRIVTSPSALSPDSSPVTPERVRLRSVSLRPPKRRRLIA